jgi:MarR family 2-MHQ and catechol resistance regulon transcriptional repressor
MTATATPAALSDERIGQFGLFVEAGRRLARIMEASLLQAHGMTSIEFEALLRVARSPEQRMSMGQLAEQMVLTSGGVTRLIDRLETAGLIARVSCPSDRRVQWAQLTDAGTAKIACAVETHLADLDRHFFAAMSPEERETLLPVLDRLRTACMKH